MTALALACCGKDGEAYEQFAETLLRRLAGDRFINQRRFNRVVDVDFLVDTMLDVFPLSGSSLPATAPTVEVVLTGVDGRPKYVELNRLSYADLRAALVGTMAIPVLYPTRATFRQEQVFDGGISDPLPLIRALEVSGARHIFAVSNVHQGNLGRPASRNERALLAVIGGLVPPLVRSQMLGRNSLGVTVDRLLESPSFCSRDLLRVSPKPSADLGDRLATDQRHLEALKQMGVDDALDALRTSGRGA